MGLIESERESNTKLVLSIFSGFSIKNLLRYHSQEVDFFCKQKRTFLLRSAAGAARTAAEAGSAFVHASSAAAEIQLKMIFFIGLFLSSCICLMLLS